MKPNEKSIWKDGRDMWRAMQQSRISNGFPKREDYQRASRLLDLRPEDIQRHVEFYLFDAYAVLN